MTSRRLLAAALAYLALSGPAASVEPDEVLRDPALEARARAISGELRCLVCQNQSIDDSDAALARDLRVLVRERLGAGDSDAQIRDFLVRRYGEFVLLKPTLSPHTALLWLGPFVVLAMAGLGVAVARRRRGHRVPESLTADEEARLGFLTQDSEIRQRSPSSPAR